MLVSKKYKFIFIHVAKVAGQSVTNALMPYAANPWQKSLSNVVPYRYQLKLYTKLKQKLGMGYFYPQPLPDHARASSILSMMGEAKFQEYYSFAFVRNPWSRAVSIYTYALKNKRHSIHKKVVELGSFKNYIKWHCSGGENIHQQRDYICDKEGSRIVNFVGKQENLTDDFGSVCSHIGISAKLCHYNASRHDFYQSYYDEETIQLVAEAYSDDIDLFRYDF